MGIKFNIKTSLVDKNVKVDTVDPALDPASNEADEVTELLEDMSGYETPGSGHVTTPFDEYMVGDMDAEAYEAAAATQQFSQSVPTLDELIKLNPKVLNNLNLVIDHYKRTEQKLKDYVKYLTDMMFTGQLDERGIAAATMKIEKANVLISTCVKGAQDAGVKESGLQALYRKEFRGGDLNNDGWIGKPYAEGSLGVQTLDSGQKIYINPVTGVAYDHPPYADTEYQAVIGRGYDIVAQDAEGYVSPLGEDDEGNPIPGPTADLEICVSDLNALQDSTFGTPAELFGVQYMWVKADDEGSFDPELAFQPSAADSATDTEPHYETADFVMQDGQIVQETPEDITKYVQVEIGSVEAYSREVDNGKGYVHYIEYRSADPSNTLVARVCIRETKTDSWVPAATSELYTSLPEDFFTMDADGIEDDVLVDADVDELTYRVDEEGRTASFDEWQGKVKVAAQQVKILNEKMSELGISDEMTTNQWWGMSYAERMDFIMQRGPAKVYASSAPLAFNTDKISSYGMKLDFSGIRSTARLTASLEQIEETLGLTRPPESDKKAYRAYMENLSAFTDTSRMWAFHANNYRDHEYLKGAKKKYRMGNDYRWIEIERNFNSAGYASVYIDPASSEARAQAFNHQTVPDYVNLVDTGDNWTKGERPVTETQSSQLTGVLVYGSGRPGHVVGTDVNDIIHVPEKNAKFDELKERFPWSEPIMPESAFSNTVIECGNGMNVVRGYDANHYVTGVTMAVIDGGSTSDNYIEAQATSRPNNETVHVHKLTHRQYIASSATYERRYSDYESETLDVNFKHYVHVDAGGVVSIDNPDETDEVLIDSEWMTGNGENLAAEYYKDDYYDVVSSTETLFGNTEDQDVIDAVPGLAADDTLGTEGEIGNKLAEMAGLIESERQKTEVPDYLESAAEEWMASYGGATEEMQTEMDDFFGTAFGEADSLFSELEAEEAGEVMGSPTTDDFINQ